MILDFLILTKKERVYQLDYNVVVVITVDVINNCIRYLRR